MKTLKKLLCILLSLLLIFSLAACGDDSGKGDDPVGPDVPFEEIDNEHTFGIKLVDGKVDGYLRKVNYKDLEAIASVLEAYTEANIQKDFGEDMVYEFTDIYEPDNWVVAYALEDEDMMKSDVEVGVYKSDEDGKWYQYITYTSAVVPDLADEALVPYLKIIKDTFGIEVEQSALAAKQADLKAGVEQYGEYSFFEQTTVDTAEYEEKVALRTIGGMASETEKGYYVYCERERLYK